MGNIINLLPVLLFLIGMLGISAYIQRSSQENRQKNFAKDYFIGGRTLGGFVLAMTTAATYSSVSTFVGGPGMAWVIGYGWLYMAIVQVIVIFLVLGVFGKKIALIGHLKLHPDALMGAKEVYIMDREPHEGDYPDSACEYILPGCDMVIITGSAAVNKTMPRLLELSRNAKTVVIGPTVPMCPELKSLGIDRLSGMVVTDKAGIIDWMQKVRGNPYPFGKSFTID